MKPESVTRQALTAFLHFWHRFKKEIEEESIIATSRIHWPAVGASYVIVCDFESREAALKVATDTIREIELQLYLR